MTDSSGSWRNSFLRYQIFHAFVLFNRFGARFPRVPRGFPLLRVIQRISLLRKLFTTRASLLPQLPLCARLSLYIKTFLHSARALRFVAHFVVPALRIITEFFNAPRSFARNFPVSHNFTPPISRSIPSPRLFLSPSPCHRAICLLLSIVQCPLATRLLI